MCECRFVSSSNILRKFVVIPYFCWNQFNNRNLVWKLFDKFLHLIFIIIVSVSLDCFITTTCWQIAFTGYSFRFCSWIYLIIDKLEFSCVRYSRFIECNMLALFYYFSIFVKTAQNLAKWFLFSPVTLWRHISKRFYKNAGSTFSSQATFITFFQKRRRTTKCSFWRFLTPIYFWIPGPY